MIRIFLIASVLLLPELALADAGFMDSLANDFKNSTSGWVGNALDIATYIFWTLAAIEFAWAAAMWAMDKDNMSSFMAAMTRKILVIGFFYTLILYGATWIPAIIESLKGSAAIIAGVPSTISPSTVIDQGLNIVSTMWDSLVDKMGITNLGSSILVAFISALATLIVILSFILIAAQYLIALIESYIVLGAGILFLGFGGSSWTRDFTQKYIGYAVSSGVKLMMILILIGVGTSVSAGWTAQLAGALNGGDIKDLIDPIFSIVGGSVLFAVLTWQIPSLASSMLSGSPALTAGGAVGTALGGAALGAGAVMGAGALASGAAAQAGGMARAVGAAAELTKAQAVAGVGPGSALAGMGMAGSAAATGLNLVSGLGGQMAQGFGNAFGKVSETSKGTVGGRMAGSMSAQASQLNERAVAMGNGGGGSSDAGAAPGNGAGGSGGSGATASSSPSTQPLNASASAASSKSSVDDTKYNSAPTEKMQTAYDSIYGAGASEGMSFGQVRDGLNEASKTGAIHELPAVGAGGSNSPDSSQSNAGTNVTGSSAVGAGNGAGSSAQSGTSGAQTVQPQAASGGAAKRTGSRRVQPPQLPPDHAPPATVNINLNTSPD